MSSIYRITIVVFLFLGASFVAFLGWRDYQIRQNEFYRLGALYKSKFPEVGKDAIEEMRGDIPTGIFALGMMPKKNIEKSDDEFIRITLEDFISSRSIDELHENVKLFMKGYESTPSTRR